MNDAMNIGPVELVVLAFPGSTVDPEAVAALQNVVERGFVTLLDLVYIAKDADGQVSQIDVDEDLTDIGLAILSIEAKALISDEDLDVVRESLEPGTSAAVIVYEQTWARELASTVRGGGGDVVLHVQISARGSRRSGRSSISVATITQGVRHGFSRWTQRAAGVARHGGAHGGKWLEPQRRRPTPWIDGVNERPASSSRNISRSTSSNSRRRSSRSPPCSPFPLQARTIWSPSCRSWDSFISPAC